MIRLKVERAPEDPSKIAVELAETMQAIVSLEDNARAFEAQILSEKKKHQNLQGIIHQLKEDHRAKKVYTSRMDPMASYDLNSLKEEIKVLKNRIVELQELANDQKKLVLEKRAELDKINKRLVEAKASIKK